VSIVADPLLLSLPLAASVVISVVLAGYAWFQSRRRTRGLFALMSVSVGFLAATYWMELASPTLGGKLFWNGLEYIVNVTIPPLFLLFTYTFLGRGEVTTRRNLALLFVIPAISLALVWTNDLHFQFYTEVSLSGEPFTSFVHSYGIGFVVHSAYSMALLLISVAALTAAYLRSSPMHRRQVRLVLIAAIMPIVALVIGLPEVVPLSLTYFFVVGFTAAGVLIFIGTFRYELFDVVPLALERMVEAVDDGIIVVDREERILFVNGLVLRRLGWGEEDVYARPLDVLSPDLPEMLRRARQRQRVEVSLPRDGDRMYRLTVTPIRDREGLLTSELLTLRDVTDEVKANQELRRANAKLSLLNSITRHDILNQLTVVRGYSELLARGGAEGGAASEYGKAIAAAGASIERQVRFTRDYQELGAAAPRWERVAAALERAEGLGLGGPLEVIADLDAIEVLADPLLDRVFSILLDNTVRHGRTATTVRVGHELRGRDLVIVYRDDGVGIPEEDKERIFELGHGAGGGVGLHLARQILEVTGMHIREVGGPGEGARFEIVVPPGQWRMSRPPALSPPA